MQETYQRESEAKQRSEELNQKIAELKRDRDLIQQQSRQLEQQLEEIPDINELTATLEGARAELDRTKEKSRNWEIYYLGEVQQLEEENTYLDRELYSAREYISYLPNIIESNNSLIPDTQDV